MEQDYVIYQNEKIEYYICRKNIKNIHIRIDAELRIIVSASKKASLDNIRKIILDKALWIKKAQVKVGKRNSQKENLNFENGDIVYFYGRKYELKIINDTKNYVELKDYDVGADLASALEIHINPGYMGNKEYIRNLYFKWMKDMADEELNRAVVKYYEILKNRGVPDPTVEIRVMKSRWGTCMCSRNKIILNLLLIKLPAQCMEYVVLHELSHFKHPNHSKKFYDFIAEYMPDWKARKKIIDEEYSGIL